MLKALTAMGIFAIVVMTTDIIIILASDERNVNNLAKLLVFFPGH